MLDQMQVSITIGNTGSIPEGEHIFFTSRIHRLIDVIHQKWNIYFKYEVSTTVTFEVIKLLD